MTMNEELIIRSAVKSDYPRIREIRERTLAESANCDEIENLRKARGWIFELERVAVCEGLVIGVICAGPMPIDVVATVPPELDFGGWTLVELGIGVLPGYRSLGVGSRLLDDEMRVGRRKGFRSCFALARSLEASKFFQRNRFKTAMSTFGIWPGPFFDKYEKQGWLEEEWADEIFLVRELTTSQQTACSSSPKVGRNDPCPCGSGKKYKKCCGGREVVTCE